MLFIRCVYCHTLIFRPLYPRHRAKHTRLRPDGQMTDHATLHPSGQYQGPLEGVPQGYRHPRCEVVTRMPEEIIRSYLVDPFLYSGGSFCCGCKSYVPYAELFWIETGECLADYFQKLQRDYVKAHGEPPPRPET